MRFVRILVKYFGEAATFPTHSTSPQRRSSLRHAERTKYDPGHGRETKQPFDPSILPLRIRCPAILPAASRPPPLFGDAALARYDTLHGIDARAVHSRGRRS